MITFLATKACFDTCYPIGPSKFRAGRWLSLHLSKIESEPPTLPIVDNCGAIIIGGIDQACLATTHGTKMAGAATRPTESERLPLLGRAADTVLSK